MRNRFEERNIPTTSNQDEWDETFCRICGKESICQGLGVIRYEVPLEDPRFGKLFRCPNNPVEEDGERKERLRRLSNLDAHEGKRFENFHVELPTLKPAERQTLQSAWNSALQFAQNPQGWLLLEGGYGCGKTHLAAAVGNECLQRGQAVLFVTAPDLLDHLRSTYGPSSETSYDEMFERIRGASLLILDDLGSESPSPWAQEKLFQLLNHRYSYRLPTVITTNVDPDRLDPRIRSRLLDSALVKAAKISAPDYRTWRLNQNDQLSSLALYNDMTFANFDTQKRIKPDERTQLETVFRIAQSYAQSPDGWLLFTAPHGCGKTHLAAAIAHYQQEHGTDVIFVTAPDLLDYLRVTFNPNAPVSFDERFQMIRNAPFLVIDHLTAEGSSWAKEKLFQILDYRYTTRRPTVITTAAQIDALDDRIRVRILDKRRCLIAAFEVASYALRMNR